MYIYIVEPQTIQSRNEREFIEYASTDNIIEYAFFGDSHAAAAINPRYFGESYNFAIGGEDYIESYFKLRYLLKKITIKTIVLQVDLHTFSDKLRTNDRLFKNYNYFKDKITNDEIISFNLSMTEMLDKRFQFIGRSEKLFGLDKLSYTYRGWTKKTLLREEIENADHKVKNHFLEKETVANLYNYRSLEYFYKVLELAEDNSIEIILISYPISKEYIDKYKKYGISWENYSINYSYPHLDYHYEFIENDTFFADADHLNSIGAEAITKRVKKDIFNILQNKKDSEKNNSR